VERYRLLDYEDAKEVWNERKRKFSLPPVRFRPSPTATPTIGAAPAAPIHGRGEGVFTTAVVGDVTYGAPTYARWARTWPS